MDFIKYAFGPELMKTNVDLELCEELLNKAKLENSNKEKVKSVTFSSAYQYSYENISYFKDKILPYIDSYLNKVSEIRNIKPYNFKSNLDELWINFQKPKDFNSPHFHAYDISFVIYVDMPDDIKKEKSVDRGFPNGSITFNYGQNLKKFNRNDLEFTEILNSYISPITQITHLPVTGEMFIFPSYLMHFVAPFFSKNIERISVAGNVTLISNKNNLL